MNEIDIDVPDFDSGYIREGLGDDIAVALENVHIVYSGIINTRLEDYANPRIRNALSARLTTIGEITGVSMESVLLDIENMTGLEVSQESAFINGVRKVVNAILEFLANAKRFFQNLFKKVFNDRNAVARQFKSNVTRMDALAKDIKNGEVERTIECNIPGKCYALFHTPRHIPKAGYRYNQEGLDKAVTGIGGCMDNLIDGLKNEANVTLGRVRDMLYHLKNPAVTIPTTITRDLKHNAKLYPMYHDKVGFMGMGVIAKPMRNQSKYHVEKYALTNWADEMGWSSVDTFVLTLETKDLKALLTNVSKTANDKLTALAMLIDSVSSSKEITELQSKLADIRNQVSIAIYTEGGTDVELQRSRQTLETMELVSEYVTQLLDNMNLLYNFYMRYLSMLTVITTKAIETLES